jgi:malonate-semialdehyde dehydrogenase (acetylating) / methylmalonate-semialdehyde dehydrogenase
LINCPFQLYGKKENNVWNVEIRNDSHNSETSTDISDSPSLSHLIDNEMRTVEYMHNSGVPLWQIISSLHQDNPNIWAISRTIYNVKIKI